VSDPRLISDGVRALHEPSPSWREVTSYTSTGPDQTYSRRSTDSGRVDEGAHLVGVAAVRLLAGHFLVERAVGGLEIHHRYAPGD